MRITSRIAGIAIVAVGAFWALGMDRAEAPVPEAAFSIGSPQGWSEKDLWLAPATDPEMPSLAARGVAFLAADEPQQAVALLAAVDDPVLRPYAQLHLAQAYLDLEQFADAARAARVVLSDAPDGYPGDSAIRLLAHALEADDAWGEALETWQRITERPSLAGADSWFRLARAAEEAGERELARRAYTRVYFEWPAASDAEEAGESLGRLGALEAEATFERELARADALFDARRWTAAHRAYEGVFARTSGEERDRVDLRLGLTDVHSGRHRQGLERLTRYAARAGVADRDEAEYAIVTALRGLGRADYPSRVERFVEAFLESPLAEAALNDLATHYILDDEDGQAAAVFAQMIDRFGEGRYADRAAWRAGWWAYRHDEYRDAIRFFEPAAERMRRADYRPAWLYWVGKSYAALGEEEPARVSFLRAIADYRNSYFGRLAAAAFGDMVGREPLPEEVAAFRDPARAIVAGAEPAGFDRVRPLLAASLWSDAVAELVALQPSRGADPVIEATIAYALNRNGELRPAITAMRRAYPQFMSDGGEALPERMLRIIFPVAHSDTIARYAAARDLDVHLLTALIAQESTFQADVRSSANAVGLMQLIPGTARRYAARAGLGPYRSSMLTDPVANVRMGTAYLSDLLARYGGHTASALAAYNAGERRVDRWRAERPGVPTDEFVDDIPFPETQNYVRRILGTVEDYRKLYEVE